MNEDAKYKRLKTGKRKEVRIKIENVTEANRLEKKMIQR